MVCNTAFSTLCFINTLTEVPQTRYLTIANISCVVFVFGTTLYRAMNIYEANVEPWTGLGQALVLLSLIYHFY